MIPLIKKSIVVLTMLPCMLLANSNITRLSGEEEAGLIKLRLEEKLARDVYSELGKMYSSNVFNNIPKSEQQHMDSMAYLLKTFNVEDPVKTDEVGIFNDENIQALHDTLMERGKKSYEEALKVGIDIEKLDIEDLEQYLNKTDDPQITQVYQQLLRGSQNHLKAFQKQLDNIN